MRHQAARPLPPVDNVLAMVIRGECIRTVLCKTVVYTHICAVLEADCWFRFPSDLGLLFVYFCHFVPVLFAVVVSGLVSPVLSQ